MALDSALFTLHFLPRHASPSIVDLPNTVPIAGTKAPPPAYTLSRALRSPTYCSTLLDGLSHAELGAISAKSTEEKSKELQLWNPDQTVTMSRKGPVLRQHWAFTWQG